MSHNISAKTVARRLFGLPRLVTIVRCSCTWKREFADPHTASVWTRHHMEGRA